MLNEPENVIDAVHCENEVTKNLRTNKVAVSPLPHYTRDRIRQIRKELHVTQKVFADIIGVSKKTIEAWECGKNIPHGPAQRMLEIMDKNHDALKEYIILKF